MDVAAIAITVVVIWTGGAFFSCFFVASCLEVGSVLQLVPACGERIVRCSEWIVVIVLIAAVIVLAE